MRGRSAFLAALLLRAPLGARGADLVVWWDKGLNPVEDEALREVIAAFEQEVGSGSSSFFRSCWISKTRW